MSIVLRLSAISLFLFGLSPFEAWAEDEKIIDNPLKAEASLVDKVVAPGAQSTLNITMDVAGDHKAYVDMFKIRWKKPEGVHVSRIMAEPSFKFEDKFSKKIREGVKGHSILSALVEFPSDLPEGDLKSEIEFTYQACTETYCHFPKTINLKIPLQVVNAAMYRASPNNYMPDSLFSALQKGSFYAFLFVFVAGLLTSLTPCVFPMIPITLAIIGARTANQTRLRSFFLSLTYVLGIALTYSVLGVVAAKTGSLFGAYLGHPLVVGAIAAVFVALGLSMYGLYDLEVPGWITQKIGGRKANAGFIGSFTTGLIAGLVASPCVGPVLVSILTYVAETKDIGFGFSLLFVFALGLGQLFLWLGTFSGLIKKLPRSGPWMEFVKFAFGTTMIAAALYYLMPVVHERVFYGLLSITLVLIASGFGAFEKPAQFTRLQQLKKGLLLLMFITGISYGIKAVWYQNYSQNNVDQSKKLNWQIYSDELLTNAAKEKKPVIIDFWADWCVACKEIEVFTLTDPRIRELSKEFVLLKIDATKNSNEIERLKRIYGVVGLPTMLFVNSKGELKKNLTLTGFEKADPFLKRMNSILK